MSDVKKAMKLIGGVEPTPEQVNRVMAIAHSLNIGNNDPLLPMLIAMDCYHGAFSTLPEKNRIAANEAANMSAKMIQQHIDRVLAEAVSAITPTMTSAMNDVAVTAVKNAGYKDMTIWALGALIASTVALIAAFALGHNFGKTSGNEEGYAVAKDEKAAAAWANTIEGKLAYRFAQTGEMSKIANCAGTGWANKNGTCFPHPTKDGTYGWTLPK